MFCFILFIFLFFVFYENKFDLMKEKKIIFCLHGDSGFYLGVFLSLSKGNENYSKNDLQFKKKLINC